MLTGLRGPILPALPPSSGGKSTVFQAKADQWDVLVHPTAAGFWRWVGGGGRQAGAAKESLEGSHEIKENAKIKQIINKR